MQSRCFYCIFIVFVLFVAGVRSQAVLFEGDQCLLGESGFYGECKKWQECPGRVPHSANGGHPSLCSYAQGAPIVCCPINHNRRSNYTAQTRTTVPPTVTTAPVEACTMRNEAQGECKNIQDCPSVISTIRNGTQPALCGFNQTNGNPIICCPVNNPSTTQRTRPNNNKRFRTTQFTYERTTSAAPSADVGEKSRQMCEYFAQFVYEVVQSPILLVDAEYYNESFCSTREHKPNQAPLRDVEEADVREFPHVANLGYGAQNNTQWLCVGSLISERYVLTTAHCINSPSNGPVRWVRVGDLSPRYNTVNSQPVHAVEERIIHEGYRDAEPSRNDIALVKLESDVPFSGGVSRPACLYTHPGNPPGHTYATSVGWGMSHWNDTTTSDKMMKKDLTFVSESQCSSSGRQTPTRWQRQITRRSENSKICVSDSSPQRSSCVGDMGSSLQIVLDTPYCMHGIVGLTSYGARACADGARPATYTRVYDFIPWIENHVWP